MGTSREGDVQRERLMMRLCESKWSAMLQLCEGKYANGVPCNVRARRTNVSTLRVDRTSHPHPHDHSATQQQHNATTHSPNCPY